MTPLDKQLNDDLHQREARALRRALAPCGHDGRHLICDGQRLLNLAGNDYLGLSQHHALKRAAAQAIETHGTGAGASRLVTGTSPLHLAVEQRFARFKHAPAALLFPTGFAANLAVLGSLAGDGDLIAQDKLNHASLIDAARSSGAEVRTYPHLRTGKLERLLRRHKQDAPRHRRFIVTDGVFSMDGDVADLPRLCDLADRYEAVLIVDDAHGTGVLGETGAGLAQAQGVAERLYTAGAGGIVVSTASKALGGLGGVVTASQAVIDYLVNAGRSFIYTTAPPPAQVAAIGAALDVLEAEPERRSRLNEVIMATRDALSQAGWQLPMPDDATPIVPLIVGEPAEAVALSKHLAEQGFYAPAIRPPTVPPGQSRLRLALRWDLTDIEIAGLARAVGQPITASA